jgi:hypothetical protein
MRQFFTTFLLSLLSLFPGIAQRETDFKEVFLTAEMYFNYDEYNEALPLYLKLKRNFPDNDNYNYKIGVCLLNNPYEKEKSINYLELAVKNIKTKSKDHNFKETAAPPEALFYLGTAYRINNNLAKAKEFYNRFLNEMDSDVYDAELVKEQLAACDVAERLMKKPIDFDVENIGQPLNTVFADKRPVLSGDETKIVFISELRFYDAIFYSEKIDGIWQNPRNIVPELGVDGDVYPTCLSYNGTELFLYRNDEFIGNLYHSRLVNGIWTPLKKLNNNINTKYWESHASISKDGKTLYFSSNRKGGFGGLDIYKSSKQSDGEWGPAVNLGSVVNSKYNDDSPFVTENEDKIFFSSYGHLSMGGYDIFMSVKQEDGNWAAPLNIGYPINSTDDDQFFVPIKDGEIAYFSRFTNDGFGRHDIYRYQIYSPDHPRLFNITGLLDFSGKAVDGPDVLITVFDTSTGDTIQQVYPNKEGKFTVKLPAGDYKMVFESDRFIQHIADLKVAQNTPHEGFLIPGTFILKPIPVVLSPEELDMLLELRDTLMVVKNGKKEKLKFNAEKGSMVIIDVFNDSILIATDTLEVNKRRMVYEFEPQPGINDIIIKLTDPQGNVVTKAAQVIYKVDHLTQIKVIEVGADTLSLQKPEEQSDQVISQQQLNDSKDQNSLFDNSKAIYTNGDLIEIHKQIEMMELADIDEEALMNLLYENADKENYSIDDVNNILTRLAYGGDLPDVIKDLTELADDNLKSTLLALDPQKENISDMDQLIEYLFNNAEEFGYSEHEVIELLSNYSQFSQTESFLNNLIKLSHGEVREYLENIDVVKVDIKNKQQLINYLIAQADKGLFEKEAIISLILQAENISAEQIVSASHTLASEELKSLIDQVPDNLLTADEVFKNMLTNASKYGLDRKDVEELFSDYLNNYALVVFLDKLKENSDGNLLRTLNNLDPKAEGIQTITAQIEYLLRNSDKFGYSARDLYAAIAKSMNQDNIRLFITDLIKYSNGNLKKALEEISVNNLKFENADELVRFLLENADKYAYSESDVWSLLLKLIMTKDANDSDILNKSANSDQKAKFNRALVTTFGILAILGFIIFIFILWERRKKKKEKGSAERK